MFHLPDICYNSLIRRTRVLLRSGPFLLAACLVHQRGQTMGNLTSTETELLDEIRHLRQDVIDLENRVADYQGLSFSADAVRESERLHRVTISSISDSVFITDDEGDFTYVCPNCHVIFGHTREIVLAHVVDGDANKIIARRLDLSIKTVEKHRSSLMKKLHVRSLPELVKLAMLAELD